MEEEKIKKYIEKYKNSFSKESIEKQLLNSGATNEEIDEMYGSLTDVIKNDENTKIFNKYTLKSEIGFLLILIYFFLIFLSYILSSLGLNIYFLGGYFGISIFKIILFFTGLFLIFRNSLLLKYNKILTIIILLLIYLFLPYLFYFI